MHGLTSTYDLLAKTANRAAIAVLADGIACGDASTRDASLRTLLARANPESAPIILTHWRHLTADDYRTLSAHSDQLGRAVSDCFDAHQLADQGNSNSANGQIDPADANRPSEPAPAAHPTTPPPLAHAIAAASSLRLFNQIDPLVRLAESSPDPAIATAATKAILRLAMPLGQAARADRAISTTRGPFLARLIRSVGEFPRHQNESLIDAFLIASTWSDSALRTWVVSSEPVGAWIAKRLQTSKSPGVVHLLAGYLRRRRLPPVVAGALQNRDGEMLGDAILRSIGDAPPAVTRVHLSSIGVPASLRGGVARCAAVTPACRAAMVHVYSSAGKSAGEVLPVTLHAIEHWNTPATIAAASLALSRCEIPSAQWSMRAAVPVAKLLDDDAQRNGHTIGDAAPTLASLGAADLPDPASVLVAALIDQLAHPDAGIAKGSRRLLTPLHAESMLSRFEELRMRSRRRLGRVVMKIDPEAVTRVRDALRHPVLERRIEAIACADALAAVELLSDSFVHISTNDHQEARIRAAQAMGNATDSQTYALLEQMMSLPESQVRDAAGDALSMRRRTDATTAR